MPSQLRMHFDVRGALLRSARQCEADVFLRWFGNTREQLDEEYGPYEDVSAFLVIATEDDDVVASVRMIAPGGVAGLKTLNDVAHPPWQQDGARAAAAVGIDLRSTWEVGTLGVRAGLGGSGTHLAAALYHGMITLARVNEMSTFVAVLDERVRRLLGSVGILTRALPGTVTAPFLGSAASTPVYCHVAPMLDNQRREFPDAYRLVTLGIGLDGIVVPDPATFQLHPRPQVDLTPIALPAAARLPQVRRDQSAGTTRRARRG